MISTIIAMAVLFCAYDDLTQPGELFGFYRKWIYESNLSDFLKKMWTCPYCMAGRFTLYISILQIIYGSSYEVLISVPAVIVLVYGHRKLVNNV